MNRMQYEAHTGKNISLLNIPPKGVKDTDFIWCPLKESPDDLLRLRNMAMQEVQKRGKARV